MGLLNKTEDIEQVEQIICDFFGTTIEEVYSRNKKSAVVLARHFLIYILNTHYSISYSKLIKRYSRSIRSITMTIKNMRHYVVYDKKYKHYYNMLIN